jgi:hypothetical protein
LLEKKSISGEEYETALDEIRLLVGKLKGLMDEMGDELEQSNVELSRKRAELQVAEAHQASSTVSVKATARLREKAVVSADELSKAEADHAANTAQVRVKANEVREVEVRMKQLVKQREMLSKTLDETTAAVRLRAQDEAPTSSRR